MKSDLEASDSLVSTLTERNIQVSKELDKVMELLENEVQPLKDEKSKLEKELERVKTDASY